MKIRSLLFVASLTLTACNPDLEGELALDFDASTSLLSVAFVPSEGLSFRSGTVFAKFSARAAKVGTDELASTCLQLSPTGNVEVAVSDYTENATIEVTIWHDDPKKASGSSDAVLPEPRPCQGMFVVGKHWTNDGPGVVEEEVPSDPTGALAPIDPIRVCGTSPITVELENDGLGPLAIESLRLSPADVGRVTSAPMPTSLAPNARMSIVLDFDSPPTSNAVLLVETDDPNAPSQLVPVNGSKPIVATNPPALSFALGQTEASFDVVNDGCGDLGPITVELLPYDDNYALTSEFSIVGCGTSCDFPQAQRITVRYTSEGDSENDLARVRVSRRDVRSDAVEVTIAAQDGVCEPPAVVELVSTSTDTPCVEQPVVVEATTEGSIDRFEWSLSDPSVEIVDLGRGFATFTPKAKTSYGVTLGVIDHCGARSPVRQLVVEVRDDCN